MILFKSQLEDDIKWKTNSNIKSETTTGQILPNFCWPNQTLQMFQIKTTFNGWQLQISNVKYISKTRSDLPQIGNVSSVDQTKLYKCFKWRRPWIKVKYINDHCLNLHLETQLSIHVQSNCLSLVELSSFQLVYFCFVPQ